MTATFTFDLDNDQELYEIYRDATKMYNVLWEFDQQLKSNIKNGDYDKMDGYVAAETIREILHDLMIDTGFKFA